MEMINLTLTPAEANCLVMMLAYFEDHENAETQELATRFTERLVAAGARPFPPAQIQVGEFKLWQIDDGATHQVAARSEEEALALYDAWGTGIDRSDPNEFSIEPRTKDFEVLFVDEPGQPKAKLSELMKGLEEPAMLATSDY